MQKGPQKRANSGRTLCVRICVRAAGEPGPAIQLDGVQVRSCDQGGVDRGSTGPKWLLRLPHARDDYLATKWEYDAGGNAYGSPDNKGHVTKPTTGSTVRRRRPTSG